MDVMQILPWAIFGLITCVVLGLMSFMNSRKSRTLERLEELRDPTLRERDKLLKEKHGMAAALERAAPTLSQALAPKTDLERNELKLRLANAGFNKPNAASIFLAIKLILLGVGLMSGAGTGYVVYGFKLNGWLAVVIGAGVGFYLPELVLALIKKGRQEKIFLQLPDALDLLVVCVEAGLGLDAGMRRVAEELKEGGPDICEEFDRCNMQMQMGKVRRECLREMGLRTGVDDVRALVATLINAERFGSSIGPALRVQSDTMRVKRRQQAEERAQKTAVQMLFPLVLFIFPGIFVVLVGPAAIMMINNLAM
ncbi:MAG TPA: type II secretion system F family protein [Planctomycetaceae bacterium]|nr:type II secretion system F family protein [Planctomycetaceae bacterium]